MRRMVGFLIGTFVCVLALLLFGVLFIGKTTPTITTTLPSPTTTTVNELPNDIYWRKTDLSTALDVIRNTSEGKNWTMGLYVGGIRYNCADFTKDAVLALRQNNFTAYPLCNGTHAWVGVDLSPNPKTDWVWAYDNPNLIQIEPQTLKVVEDYIDGRRCVVRGIW